MRVCLLTPNYPPNVSGGGEISAQLLAEQVSYQTDATVDVLSFDGDRTETINGISVTRVSAPESPLEIAFPPTVFHLLSRRDQLQEYDVLHSYNVYHAPAVALVGALMSIPVVVTLNSYALLPRQAYAADVRLLRRLYDTVCMPTTGRGFRWATSLADAIIALSTPSKRVFAEHGFDPESITVVPNMIDPSFSTPPDSSDQKTERLLYVGKLTHDKGPQHLIDALQHLPETVTASFVGDGPARQDLEIRAERQGITNRVVFTGRVPYDMIGEQYAASDVLVHPAIWPEPFGRIILEAMQAGLPVVATNCGGPSEIIPQPGCLVPPGAPEKLADAIQYALMHRTDISDTNQSIISDRYAPKAVCKQLLAVYRTAKAT